MEVSRCRAVGDCGAVARQRWRGGAETGALAIKMPEERALGMALYRWIARDSHFSDAAARLNARNRYGSYACETKKLRPLRWRVDIAQ
jgi:hypothetical protein